MHMRLPLNQYWGEGVGMSEGGDPGRRKFSLTPQNCFANLDALLQCEVMKSDTGDRGDGLYRETDSDAPG